MSIAINVPVSVAQPKQASRHYLLILKLLALFAVVGLLIVSWQLVFRDRLILRNWGEVVEGKVFRSGQISQHLIESVIKDNRLEMIIFMSEDKANRPDVDAERYICDKLMVERINCPLPGDGVGDINQYAAALRAIIRAGYEYKPVLLHCHTGAQRTGGAIAFYQAIVEKKSGSEIYRDLLKYNHDPKENPKLIPYINEHMHQLAEMLTKDGTIASVPQNLPVVAP